MSKVLYYTYLPKWLNIVIHHYCDLYTKKTRGTALRSKDFIAKKSALKSLKRVVWFTHAVGWPAAFEIWATGGTWLRGWPTAFGILGSWAGARASHLWEPLHEGRSWHSWKRQDQRTYRGLWFAAGRRRRPTRNLRRNSGRISGFPWKCPTPACVVISGGDKPLKIRRLCGGWLANSRAEQQQRGSNGFLSLNVNQTDLEKTHYTTVTIFNVVIWLR